MSGAGANEDIDIIPFEPRFQSDVVELFKQGYSSETYNLGPIVDKQAEWWVDRMLSQQEGDLYNIWDTYMTCEINALSTDCRHFWVAIDELKNDSDSLYSKLYSS